MNKLASLLAVLLLSGCGDIFGPPPVQIADATLIVDPVRFNHLWARLEACSGLYSIFGPPDVYRTPLATVKYHGSESEGMYMRNGRRVFIGIVSIGDNRLVLHEFMHALTGHKTHEPRYFNGACGDLIHINTQPPLEDP